MGSVEAFGQVKNRVVGLWTCPRNWSRVDLAALEARERDAVFPDTCLACPILSPRSLSLQRAGARPSRAPCPAPCRRHRRCSSAGAGRAAGEGRPGTTAAAGPAARRAPRAERQGGAAAEPRPGEPPAPAQAPGQLRLPTVPAPVQLLSGCRPRHEPPSPSPNPRLGGVGGPSATASAQLGGRPPQPCAQSHHLSPPLGV